MTLALSGWMLYTMWAILGLMGINLLLNLFRSAAAGSFSPKPVLDYLKDVLTYVLPLFIIANLMPLDGTGWLLQIAYYVGGIAVVWNYLSSIKNRF